MANDNKPSVEETITALRDEYPEAVDAIESAKYADGCDHGFADGEKQAKEKHDAELVAALDQRNKDESDRLSALREKYGEKDAAFVLDQFAAGHDTAKAAEAWAELCEQREAKARQALKDATDKLIDREAGNDAGSGHNAPVEAAAPTEPESPESIEDPEARAKAEWQAMSADDRKKYYNEDVYVAARKRELRG